MDERPVGAPRRVLRHAAYARETHLSQLLPIGRALAIHGNSSGKVRMSSPLHSNNAQHATQPAGTSGILADVIAGLRSNPKRLPPKLFYDEEGARLFERICALDEYYLTRSELSILRRRAAEIAELAGPECALIEYGSGAGVKVRLLLDALDTPVAYVPIDISSAQLAAVAADLEA